MNAFEIRNLECAYSDGQTVLEVQHLDISFGKIIVFLGPSGVGKSTLLETLGLMNFTIKKGEVKFSFCENDFSQLWDSDENISEIRNTHMSFIFQENNLLENISAVENAMMPLLIQGKTHQEAKDTIYKWCNDLDLSFIDDQTKVTELSVGQKQRLAFIRAASPDFTVLFGDEPTGNLDEKNGGVLMRALQDKINGDASKMLSIIVSHDIDLAVKYADQIVVLTKNATRLGEIKAEHVYLREENHWTSGDQNFQTEHLRKLISELL